MDVPSGERTNTALWREFSSVPREKGGNADSPFHFGAPSAIFLFHERMEQRKKRCNGLVVGAMQNHVRMVRELQHCKPVKPTAIDQSRHTG